MSASRDMQVVGEGVFLKVSLISPEISNHFSFVGCVLDLLKMPRIFMHSTLQAQVSKKLKA